jgi:hypothetical protein
MTKESESVKMKLHLILSGKECNKSDFKDLKDLAHRRFSDEFKEAICDTTLYNLNPPYWAYLESCTKKLESKKFNKTENGQVLEVLRSWAKIIPLLEEVATHIENVRKVSVVKAPSRTLENTGTCAICAQNTKLLNGKIVNHGYEVKCHQHVGGICFGVNYPPLEVSSEARIKYVEHLKKLKIDLERRSKPVTPLSVGEKLVAGNLRGVNRELAFFEKLITKTVQAT